MPIVIEQTGRGERSYDIFSRYGIYKLNLEDKFITLLHKTFAGTRDNAIGPCMDLLEQASLVLTRTSKINDGISALTVAQLLFLEAEESTKPIHLYINSPGGSVTAGMGIYDTVRSFHLNRSQF